VAESVARCADRGADATELERRLALAEQDAEAGRAAADDAWRALRHLEQEHAATALRAGLAAGERCPVCEGVVGALPHRREDLEAVLADARAAGEGAEAREREATDAVVALRTRCRGGVGRRRGCGGAVEEVARARTAVPEGQEVSAPAEAADALAHAEEDLASVERVEAAARATQEEATARAAEARTEAATAAERADG